jgi:NADPH-dependent glutamate synthase beta subunit-like oxidoreductase
MPLKFITRDHRITGLTCAKTELKARDGQGRPAPIQIEGSEFSMSADMVISAVGQKADHDSLINGLSGKKLEPDTGSLATNLPKVFVAGDFAQGSSTVVEAMANGKKAAMKVHEYLSRLG